MKYRVATICLAAVLASLLLVGAVSGTVVRHLVQVLPLGLALAVVRSRSRWSPHVAMPLFGFWFVLMSLIWLYLMGVETFFSGTFSRSEVALTLLIALFSAVGLVASRRMESTVARAKQTTAVVLTVVLQIGAMWISFLPVFANR